MVAVLQSVLRKDGLRRRVGTDGRSVMLAAAPGEGHSVPLDALTAALEEAGVACCAVYILPAAAIRSALDRSHADAVVVWARRPTSAVSR